MATNDKRPAFGKTGEHRALSLKHLSLDELLTHCDRFNAEIHELCERIEMMVCERDGSDDEARKLRIERREFEQRLHSALSREADATTALDEMERDRDEWRNRANLLQRRMDCAVRVFNGDLDTDV